MRNIDVMFSCDYSSSQQKLKLVNTCIFLWHVWHFRKKIRQCYSHSSNVPELFSSERSWQKKKAGNAYIYFLFSYKNVMNIYRGLSSPVICNAKCFLPQNNLRERLHST